MDTEPRTAELELRSQPDTMLKLTSLPSEIILLFIENCSFDEIAVLRRVCKLFRSLADRLLASAAENNQRTKGIWYRSNPPLDPFLDGSLDLYPRSCRKQYTQYNGAQKCTCRACFEVPPTEEVKVHAALEEFCIPRAWENGTMQLREHSFLKYLAGGAMLPKLLSDSLFSPPLSDEVFCRFNYKMYRPLSDMHYDEDEEVDEDEWRYPYTVYEDTWKLTKADDEENITLGHFIKRFERTMWWEWRLEERLDVTKVVIRTGGDPLILDIQIHVRSLYQDEIGFDPEKMCFKVPEDMKGWNSSSEYESEDPEEVDSDDSEFWPDEEDASDLEVEDGKLVISKEEEAAIQAQYGPAVGLAPDATYNLLAYVKAGAVPMGMEHFFLSRRSGGTEQVEEIKAGEKRRPFRECTEEVRVDPEEVCYQCEGYKKRPRKFSL